MNKVIYTAIIRDGSDKPLKITEPKMITPGWDYIAFVDDSKLVSKYWTLKYVDRDESISARKQSRRYKILNDKYLPSYDISIYIDSRMFPSHDLNKFVSEYLPHDYNIAMMNSPKRQCVYKELEHCMKHTQCPKEDLIRQYEKYKFEGVPCDLGLMRAGMLLRRHGVEDQIKFMEEWMEELLRESERDTPSFAYTLWKHPLKINALPTKKVYGMFTGR